jgi:hypothetical protein
MIIAKINVTRILKEHLYQGKNGKYLDLVIFENKNGPDQYGNTHMVIQGVSKEARDRGVKGPIIGNLKLESQPRPKPPQARSVPESEVDSGFGSVPF